MNETRSQSRNNIDNTHNDKLLDNNYDSEKFNRYKEEISNDPKSFEENIKNLFMTECEEKIQSILLLKESDFLQSISQAAKNILEEMYSSDALSERTFNDILSKCQRSVKCDFYIKNYKILSTAWNDYETNLQTIKKYKFKISSKNEENFSFLKHYRKHCAMTDSFAFHKCSGEVINSENPTTEHSKLLEVTDDSEGASTSHVICVTCKKSFSSSCMLLYCSPCNLEYYSSVLPESESADLQPATWTNYHCGALINDKMKCIKCREIFYLNIKTGLLNCLNCKFEAKPKSIVWSCMMCKKDFSSSAKIYNPMEFKLIKAAIRLVLMIKNNAIPAMVPCCKVDVNTQIFKHKKECTGRLYQGEYDKKVIVVCEKCKSMNFYDKYIWTCPICFKRFKNSEAQVAKPQPKDSFKKLEIPIQVEIAQKTPVKRINPPIHFRSNSEIHAVMEQIFSPSISNLKLNSKKIRGNLNETIEDRRSSQKSNHPDMSYNVLNTDYQVTTLSTNCNIIEDHNFTSARSSAKNSVYCKIEDTPKTEAKKNLDTIIEKLELLQVNKTPSTFQIEEEEKKKSVSKYNSGIKNSFPILNKIIEENESTMNEVKVKLDFSVKESEDIYSSNPSEKLKIINIDDFRIIKQIGEGSFGQIYLVECNRTLRRLAMKKMIAHKKKELRNFKQEFEMLHSIQHSNILRIFGVCERVLDKTTYALYVVMEPATSDWETEICTRQQKKKPYSEEEIIDIMKQLIKGLAFLQRKNISHRDIKPQNVLCFEKGIYKVADFGEAKAITTPKEMSTLRGTELYMSPILIEGYKKKLNEVNHNTFKSDVFSLGYCFLYAATLTFNSLYDIRDLTEMKAITGILHKYLKNRYTSKFFNLLNKMIEIDEDKRLDFVELEEYINQNLK
jgi:hypothetical protein